MRIGDLDVIALLDTGAYQEVSCSNFNAMPRPAAVLVHGGVVGDAQTGGARADPVREPEREPVREPERDSVRDSVPDSAGLSDWVPSLSGLSRVIMN